MFDQFSLYISFIFRVETQVFKTKFSGWDDVIAVDFTRTASRVAELRKVCHVYDLEYDLLI